MVSKSNIILFYSIFLISILFLSLIVAAAGTGSGGSTTASNENETSNNNSDNNNETRDIIKINRTINNTKLQLRKIAELKDYNCEEFENRTQRIKCRLMIKFMVGK